MRSRANDSASGTGALWPYFDEIAQFNNTPAFWGKMEAGLVDGSKLDGSNCFNDGDRSYSRPLFVLVAYKYD